jgi:hypothetical protein
MSEGWGTTSFANGHEWGGEGLVSGRGGRSRMWRVTGCPMTTLMIKMGLVFQMIRILSPERLKVRLV